MTARPLLALMLSLATILAPPAVAAAKDRPTPLDVHAITLRAATLLQEEGVETARQNFHADGPFRFGEIYVNVIDLNGAWVIYPPAPRNEGKSVLNVVDSDGKLLVREIIRVAETQGEGWVEYRWLNPASNRIEPKLTFVKRIPGKDLIAYVGLYRP